MPPVSTRYGGVGVRQEYERISGGIQDERSEYPDPRRVGEGGGGDEGRVFWACLGATAWFNGESM